MPLATQLIQYVLHMLAEPYSAYSDFFLKSECYHALNLLWYRMPVELEEAMRPIIPVTLEILMLCTAEYTQVIMGTKGPPTDVGEDANDSRQFYDLIYNILCFFEVFPDRLRTTLLYDKLGDIIYYLIVYMAVTAEIEKKWLEDEDFFATCDDDFHHDVRLRMKARLVLLVSLLVLISYTELFVVKTYLFFFNF